MATTGRPDEPATPASDVAAACREAGLVRLVGARTGEALSAVGLLGRALSDAGVPFQARLVSAASGSLGATDADCTIAVCRPDLPADHAITPTATATTAARTAAIGAELGTGDPVLGLATALAAGDDPGGAIHQDATTAGVERRPGLAVPTGDLADGLAHTTLVHAPFSGDRTAAEDALAGLDLAADPDEGDRRRVASLVALAVAETETCPPQATRAVERVLHPYVGGPTETVGGYADLLDALARADPGLGIAVALGTVDADAGLDAWRDHGRRVHRAVREVGLERHDGLVVARADELSTDETQQIDLARRDAAVLGPVGRLVRDYRSPEPTVLVRGTDAVVLTTIADELDADDVLADATSGAAPGVAGDVVGTATTATAPIGDGQDGVVEGVRRAVR